MIDEEMAEERATKFMDINFNEPDNYGSAKEIGYFSYKAGFLAGLKAGRPKWHDLRKDPNDLPSMIRDEREISQNVWIHIKNWGTECSYYSYHRKVWMVRCREVNLPVLAWCEIPEYTEE